MDANLRTLDPVIEARLNKLMGDALHASSAAAAVRAVLLADNTVEIGSTSSAELAYALELAQRGIEDVADRLDKLNVCDGSRYLVVRSEHKDEVPDDA